MRIENRSYVGFLEEKQVGVMKIGGWLELGLENED